MFDIGLHLVGIHGFEVVGGDHPLAQLLQPVAVHQRVAELRLAQKQRLEQGMRAQLEVGQHPQFFQCLDRKVLRLVDDQQAAPPGARLFVQEAFDGTKR